MTAQLHHQPPEVGIDARGRLIARHVYAWHEAIRDIPGARYAGQQARYWYMPASPEIAARLLSVLSESGALVSPRVAALVADHEGREARRAAAADESAPLPRLPWHEWLRTNPWDHQKRGINFIKESSAVAIGSGMGTGKSLMVVGGANAKQVRKLLIVAPAKAAGVWPREFRLHSSIEWHVVNGNVRGRRGALIRQSLESRWRSMVDALTRCGCGKPHAVVVGYEALAKDPMASADMNALGIEMVVHDECHRLKSPSGGSSWTAASWVGKIPNRVGLSGTLMPQSPADVYAIYRALDPGIFGTNYQLFCQRYIVMRKNREGTREFPVDVLKEKRVEFSRKFHSICYLPVVDLRLPPMIHNIVPVEFEPAARRAYDDVRDKGIANLREAMVAAGQSVDPDADEVTVAPANSGVELLRLAQLTGGATRDDENNTVIVSHAKANALAELLNDVGCRRGGTDGRHQPEPVVVFCRFRHDLDAVRGVAEAAQLRYAEVSGARKDGLDADAKMNPDCDVVGVQIASGGEAVDFTRAHIVVWWSVGFELWRFQQAQKRVHRPGQTRPTLNYYLIVENTIDGIIYASLNKKERVIDTIVAAAYARGGADAEPSTESLPGLDTEGELITPEPGVPSWLLPETTGSRKRATPERDREAAQLALIGMEGLGEF
jgi:hypothetical protein